MALANVSSLKGAVDRDRDPGAGQVRVEPGEGGGESRRHVYMSGKSTQGHTSVGVSLMPQKQPALLTSWPPGTYFHFVG